MDYVRGLRRRESPARRELVLSETSRKVAAWMVASSFSVAREMRCARPDSVPILLRNFAGALLEGNNRTSPLRLLPRRR